MCKGDAIDTYQNPHGQDIDDLIAQQLPATPSDPEESNR